MFVEFNEVSNAMATFKLMAGPINTVGSALVQTLGMRMRCAQSLETYKMMHKASISPKLAPRSLWKLNSRFIDHSIDTCGSCDIANHESIFSYAPDSLSCCKHLFFFSLENSRHCLRKAEDPDTSYVVHHKTYWIPEEPNKVFFFLSKSPSLQIVLCILRSPQTHVRCVCVVEMSRRAVPCRAIAIKLILSFRIFGRCRAGRVRVYAKINTFTALVFASSCLCFGARINLKLSAHFTLSDTHSAYIDALWNCTRCEDSSSSLSTSTMDKNWRRKEKKKNYTHNFHITFYLALYMGFPGAAVAVNTNHTADIDTDSKSVEHYLAGFADRNENKRSISEFEGVSTRV